MATPTILITAPMLRVTRRVPVTGGGDAPWHGGSPETILDPESFAAVRAAKAAGARVVCVFIVESSLADDVRQAVTAIGAEVDLLETGGASVRHTTYVGEDGQARFEVIEGAPPSSADVDRLLDRVGRHIEETPDRVVVSGDLEGGPRRDFAERVVGRAWGLGVRTVLVPDGPSLKQAFHTQPLAAWARASDLQSVSPPDEGETETEEETLKRIFEDPVRLLYVRRDDGTVFAAARAGNRELGQPAEWHPGGVLGAFAALLPVDGEEYLDVAVRAFEAVSTTNAAQPTA